jgi:cysteinyl-tRNA synthetase
MDDDLSAPAAMAVIHDTVRRGNAALGGPAADASGAVASTAEVRAMLGVFGIDPFAEPWSSRASAGVEATHVIDELVSALLDQRAEARMRKDYAAADAVRDRLGAAGVEVEDTPTGSRWSIRR